MPLSPQEAQQKRQQQQREAAARMAQAQQTAAARAALARALVQGKGTPAPLGAAVGPGSASSAAAAAELKARSRMPPAPAGNGGASTSRPASGTSRPGAQAGVRPTNGHNGHLQQQPLDVRRASQAPRQEAPSGARSAALDGLHVPAAAARLPKAFLDQISKLPPKVSSCGGWASGRGVACWLHGAAWGTVLLEPCGAGKGLTGMHVCSPVLLLLQACTPNAPPRPALAYARARSSVALS